MQDGLHYNTERRQFSTRNFLCMAWRPASFSPPKKWWQAVKEANDEESSSQIGGIILSVSMLASLAVNAAAVDAGANLPEEVSYAVSANAYSGSIGLEFGDDYADWIDAINGVEVNGEKYNDGNDSFSLPNHIGGLESLCRESIAVMRELNSPEWRILPPQL